MCHTSHVTHHTSHITCHTHVTQSLVRIPDTLLMAMEFLTLYTPSEHNQV